MIGRAAGGLGGTDVSQLTDAQLRDYLLAAHQMAIGQTMQSDTEMRRRIGNLLMRAIKQDDIMRNLLVYGRPEGASNISAEIDGL